jgi:urea carboxylase
MWNRYKQTADFRDGKQWLLRFFDQIRFYPVSHEELQRIRHDFVAGHFQLKVEHSELDLGEYSRFLQDNADSITAFKHRQQTAFDGERERWEQTGAAHYEAGLPDDVAGSDAPFDLPAGCVAVASPVTGSVWDIPVKAGDRVNAGDALVVVEAMKMEIAVESDETGVVTELLCAQGNPVSAGQALVIIKPEGDAG